MGDILIEPPVSAFPKPTRKTGAIRFPVIPYPNQGEGKLLVLPKMVLLIIWAVLPLGEQIVSFTKNGIINKGAMHFSPPKQLYPIDCADF